jgi:hypothetical protein
MIGAHWIWRLYLAINFGTWALIILAVRHFL